MEHPDKTFFFKELLSDDFVPSKLELLCRRNANNCFIVHDISTYSDTMLSADDITKRIEKMNLFLKRKKIIKIIFAIQMPRVDVFFNENAW